MIVLIHNGRVLPTTLDLLCRALNNEQVVWLAFWMLTAGAVNYALTSGTAVDPERPSRGAHNFAYLGLVLSLLWGSQVIKYLTHMTTAGRCVAQSNCHPEPFTRRRFELFVGMRFRLSFLWGVGLCSRPH